MVTTTATHVKISQTAKLVAHLRTLTDIRYSKEIAAACNAEQTFNELVGENPQDFLWPAPIVEMRYKSVDAILRTHNPVNILELAVGLSPRGLIWSDDRSCNFLETDLPDILDEKTGIAMGILGNQPRENLHWLPVNATNEDHFLAASSFFEEGPVDVICEGLLPYLYPDEQERVGRNIRTFLKEHGGRWITPDLSSSSRMKQLIALDPKIGDVLKTIFGRTGRDLQAIAPATMEQAEKLYTDLGFKVTKFSQRELVPNPSSLGKVVIDPAKLDIIMDLGMVWVMEVV